MFFPKRRAFLWPAVGPWGAVEVGWERGAGRSSEAVSATAREVDLREGGGGISSCLVYTNPLERAVVYFSIVLLVPKFLFVWWTVYSPCSPLCSKGWWMIHLANFKSKREHFGNFGQKFTNYFQHLPSFLVKFYVTLGNLILNSEQGKGDPCLLFSRRMCYTWAYPSSSPSMSQRAREVIKIRDRKKVDEVIQRIKPDQEFSRKGLARFFSTNTNPYIIFYLSFFHSVHSSRIRFLATHTY